MKADGWTLLESLFVPKYRHLLPQIYYLIDHKQFKQMAKLIYKHVSDVEEEKKIKLDLDIEKFPLFLVNHKRALLGRLQVIKIRTHSY